MDTRMPSTDTLTTVQTIPYLKSSFRTIRHITRADSRHSSSNDGASHRIKVSLRHFRQIKDSGIYLSEWEEEVDIQVAE